MNQDLSEAIKLLEVLENRFLSLTIDDFVNQPEVVDKLDTDMERDRKVVTRLEDKYMKSEGDEADKLSTISGKIIQMQNAIYSVDKSLDRHREYLFDFQEDLYKLKKDK